LKVWLSIFKEVLFLAFKIDHTFSVLEAAINGSIARQKVIAHNVSNINTPGFKRFLADFTVQPGQQTLPLNISSPKHISLTGNQLALKIEKDNYSEGRADGNNVDLEHEMTQMVKNDVYNNAAINQLNKKLAIQRYVITDGKG
jgi:flagellar basal-body rod protein FlgB